MRKRFGIALLCVAAAYLALFAAVFATGGANNRLESVCPGTETKNQSWVYHRDSWLPLRWSCTITRFDGTVDNITVWETLW